jgi:ADP-ribose pyrophosphatase YjhB (NUDIX family)
MSMTERFRPFAAVYLFFVRDGKILLLRRANTGHEDGNYSLVAGHIDGNESLRAAAAREAKEEAGVDINVDDLELKLVTHSLGDREYVNFYFEAKTWEGEPTNMEPEKCDDLSWFPLDELPSNTVPYVREAIHCYREGVRYLERGWGEENKNL